MKAWYKSKTLWFNAIAMSLVAVESIFQVLQPILGTVFYPVALVGITVINSILRVVSSQKLIRHAKPKS